jgi:F-type H+-transporting ATPase subunit a
MAYDPHTPYAIKQFAIDVLVPLEVFGIDASLTVSSQAMITTVLVGTAFVYWGMREGALYPRRLQTSVEALYGFVHDTVVRFGTAEAKRAVPFVFTVFVYILFGTLIGLTPIKFTFTSHLIVTLALALTVFAYVNWLAFRLHGLSFLRFFLPAGAPLAIAPLIVLVELISYLFRPVTLGVRIFANILAGHIMLKLFGDLAAMLVDNLGIAGFAVAILPFAMIVLMYAVEVFITSIQAYIFIVITSLYIKDAIHAH